VVLGVVCTLYKIRGVVGTFVQRIMNTCRYSGRYRRDPRVPWNPPFQPKSSCARLQLVIAMEMILTPVRLFTGLTQVGRGQ
jgi:hypothetical protein